MRGMWKVIKRRWNYLVAKLSGRFEETADPKVQLEQAMAEYASSPAYHELLTAMVKYATKRLGGKVGVVCRKADEAALKSAGAKVISTNLKAIGGFKAENEDRTLELDLTFEEILRGREDDVRAAVLGKE